MKTLWGYSSLFLGCTWKPHSPVWRNTPPVAVTTLAFTPGAAFDSLWEHAKCNFKWSTPERWDWRRERDRRKERESWDPLMASGDTLSSSNWSISEMGGMRVLVCVSVCVQFSEEVQFNAEGRESWFICPVLLIAAFKGTAGKGDGWAWFALPFSPPVPWSDPHRDRQHHFSHGQEKKKRTGQ